MISCLLRRMFFALDLSTDHTNSMSAKIIDAVNHQTGSKGAAENFENQQRCVLQTLGDGKISGGMLGVEDGIKHIRNKISAQRSVSENLQNLAYRL